MSERGHALDAFLRGSARADRSTVAVSVLPARDVINLRGDAGDKSFVEAVGQVLRQELPLEANTFTTAMSTTYWVGPDEWLIVSPGDERPTLPTLLDDALGNRHATMNMLSGGYVALRISGEDASNLLAKGCTLDFHPGVFRTGQCAQSGLAKASVLIAKADEAPVYDVLVRRSFAEYVAHWLRHAGAEYGIRFD